LKGLITKTTGSAYAVLLDDGTTIEAHVKGNFRIQGIRSTNPVAVGDRVSVQFVPLKQDALAPSGERDGERGSYWINAIDDRRNYIIRRSTNLSKQSHILAANIDQAALIITIDHPKTSTTFIDRFLATCEAYRVPAVLLFNKIDLLSEEDQAELEYQTSLYSHLGYPCFCISAKALKTDAAATAQLAESVFRGKTTLLSGNSGVGKSTLLNALIGREVTRTGIISDAHDKGMHTTTFSEMYFLKPLTPNPLSPEGARGDAGEEEVLAPLGERMPAGQERGSSSAVIDTPGIKGFGTFDFQKEEVGHYFREIFRISDGCRFGNCTHTNEPGCAVQPAVESGEIAFTRFESYLSLLGDCEENKYR